MTDKEYLARPELDVKFEYNKGYINIASEHTCYIRHSKMTKVNQKEILEIYSNIIKLCREMGIKIKYSFKYKKFVLDNWKKYVDTYNEYEKKFNYLLTLLPKLEDRGIHQGSSDDAYLNQVMKNAFELDPYFYRDNILFQMNQVYHELGRIENELIYEKNRPDRENSLFGKTISLGL